jgi:hypothetical protein
VRDPARAACLVIGLGIAAGCADAPVPAPRGDPETPAVVRIVCEADGATTVGSETVLVQADGVHVRVESRLDEPASVDPFGRDVEPGVTRFVSSHPPGRVDVSCYPFSQNESGQDPPSTPLELLDPEGLYVDPKVDCSGEVGSYIADYAAPGPDHDIRIPLEEARAEIDGLQPSDELAYGGYPDAVPTPVLVVRGDEVIASIMFAAVGERWTAPSGTFCGDSGISVI